MAMQATDMPKLEPLPPSRKGVGWGTILLVAFSVLFGFLGLVQLSQATVGIGLIAFGCYLAILGRIAQAGDHRNRE